MAFRFLTGINFVLTIADDFSAFSCPSADGLVIQLPAVAFSSFPFLRTEVPILPVRFDLMFRFFRTGHCSSVPVARSFLTTSLSDSYRIDSLRAGMAIFHFLTGIRFVLTIADDFSAFSCPTEIEPV
jgi:hypothetical protein